MSIKMLYRMVWKLSTVDDMRFDCCWLYALSLPSGSRGMLHCKVDLKLLLRPAPFSNQRIASLPEPLVCTKITLGSKFRHKFRRKLPSRITANCSHVYSYHITAQIAFFFWPKHLSTHSIRNLGMVSKAEFSASHLSPSQLASPWEFERCSVWKGWVFVSMGVAATRNHNFADKLK